uniref:isoleucine--tRNA ligase n=1 Tax=viral metagenome TaxID=1070528 RepID=A0A6C0JTI9_9ZZZZ
MSKDCFSKPFVLQEKEVLKFWKNIKAFETSNILSTGKPEFIFYDGPPFATGLPHYGHILTGTIKDIITRYFYQSGYSVSRRFGWDCHGLPIEFEIDKKLNINRPDQIRKFGIDKYNNECRKIVTRYTEEWEAIIDRTGRWVDFKNDYKTMDLNYMESVWFVFKELFNKGLVYQGVKVMPYSTRCGTPLSNFEASSNFKMVNDPEIIVTFKRYCSEDLFLVYTTTPWTLISNLALCVNPIESYIKIFVHKDKKLYILMEKRLPSFKLKRTSM